MSLIRIGICHQWQATKECSADSERVWCQQRRQGKWETFFGSSAAATLQRKACCVLVLVHFLKSNDAGVFPHYTAALKVWEGPQVMELNILLRLPAGSCIESILSKSFLQFGAVVFFLDFGGPDLSENIIKTRPTFSERYPYPEILHTIHYFFYF